MQTNASSDLELDRDGMRKLGYEIAGRTVLRFCTIQPTTTEEDIRVSIDCLERMAAQLTDR